MAPKSGFFALQGRLVAPILAKFGMEEAWRSGKFCQNRCTGQGYAPKTEKFYEILEYKRPAAFPLLDYYKTFNVYVECFL